MALGMCNAVGEWQIKLNLPATQPGRKSEGENIGMRGPCNFLHSDFSGLVLGVKPTPDCIQYSSLKGLTLGAVL